MSHATFPAFGTRSTFGAQPLSRRKTSPQFGFGSSTREDQEKVFISQDHAELNAGGVPRSPGPATYVMRAAVGPQVNGQLKSSPLWGFGSDERFRGLKGANNPGPGTYALNPSIGPQPVGTMSSLPKWGFGSSTREHQAKVFITAKHAELNTEVARSPGPAVYTMRNAVGPQVNARIKSMPSWVFGSDNRFDYTDVKRAAATPGPGTYPLLPAIGPQPVGCMPSAPMAGFGTSTRDHQAKVYQSADHEKYIAGVSPGPAVYNYTPALGRQTTSRLKSSACWGFGTEPRFDKKRSPNRMNGPGPGAYLV